ncbi:MAG: leucine-rich repeat domain-containing protein [Lachnospiraceae bacterium]|nr:leucine-rich repeat domain-containing protein [Lachnospiraceae bacterium]
MKRIRKLLGVILIIVALLVMQLPPLGADAASVPEFSVTGSGTLVSYNGSATNVVIPSSVIEIATDAFRDNDHIRSVTIPGSVKKIHEYAFWDCDNLQSVNIGSGLSEIDDFVFANCMGLVSVNIPSNIKTVGIYAFEDDVNLESVTFTEHTRNIHESAFDGCYKLVIFAPEGSYAWKYAQGFYVRQSKFTIYEDTGMIDVIDETVTHDEPDAEDVSGNGETEVIEETDPYGEPGAYTTEFEITQRPDGTYTAVAVNQNTDIYGQTHVVGNSAVVFMDNSSMHVINGSDIQAAESEAVHSDHSDPEITYSSTILKYTIVDSGIVADKAYYMSGELTNMSLPSGVHEIGQFAFSRTEVVSVTLPEGVKTIDYGAFYHCDRLLDVQLPTTVEKIEPFAFSDTPWVEDFLSGTGGINNQLDGRLNASDGDFLVSGGALIAYRGDGANVTVPNGVRIIAAEVFKGNTTIKTLALPDSLISIGEGAFMGCTSLEEVSFGGNEEEILDRAFMGTGVSVKDIPDRIRNVGVSAFDDLDSVTGLNITCEESTRRLSNISYRSSVEDKDNAGVTVYGTEGVLAYLDGADRPYDMTIGEVEGSPVLDRALERASGFLSNYSLGDRTVYDITLRDSSGISIDKLGNQGLEIAIPIPEELKGDKLVILTVDRNGQLEDIPVTVVNTGGKEFARFTTYHLSPFALYSTGTALSDSDIISSEVTLRADSGGPAIRQQDNSVRNWLVTRGLVRWMVFGLLVITGVYMIAVRKKHR